jgi:hypothetical protein
MREEVKNFVNKCKICQYGKGRQHNTGLYHLLPIPERSWGEISMDVFLGFPRNKKGSDSIFVVVGIFSKMAHFIPCQKKNDATHIANLFFRVVRLNELLRSLVSDRDTKFVGNFWRTIWKRLGMNLSFSSSYHPQRDGHIEVVNMSLGNLLRSLVTKQGRKWDQILAQA